MSSKEKAFEVKRRKEMINSSHPLRHAVVVSIFRLERKFLETSKHRPTADTAIGPHPPQNRIAVLDQPQTNVAALRAATRGTEDHSDKIVVEVWRAYGELSLFQRENSVVIPRGLTESSKSDGVQATQLIVCVCCMANVRKNLRAEQSGESFSWLEHNRLAHYFATIGSGYPYWGYLTGPFLHVQVWRTAHVHASVCKIHAALGVMGETEEKLVSYFDHLVRLSADLSHPAS